MPRPVDNPLVEFRNVSYTVGPQNTPIISDLNLTVQPGETPSCLVNQDVARQLRSNWSTVLLVPSAGEAR